MTLGEAIKNRRIEQGLTQRALAGMLGVSDMTVSRMEANQSFRTNYYISEILVEFLGEEYLSQITDNSQAANELRSASDMMKRREQNNDFSSNFFYTRPSRRVKRAEEKQDFAGKMVSLIYSQGLPVRLCELPPQSELLQGFDICCAYEKKVWVLDLYNKEYQPQDTLQFQDILPILFTRVGRAAFEPGIHKYSLLVDADCLGPTDVLFSGMYTKQLNFDVSILRYNAKTNKFDYELDLAFHSDGRGFFDLSVPGCEAETAKLFSVWKSSFANGVK